MNVLVTGGAGYIGPHTCKALAEAGFRPIAYDNMVSGHEWAVQWGPLIRGDILDRQRLGELFREYKPIGVMHFAAYADVGESMEEPLKYYRNNVAGTLTLLETMRENSVDQMVFSSTCATYGVPQTIPISELHEQNPINPYGASKLVGERMLADVGTAHGIRSVLLRYFNAAGADPDGELGEERLSEGHLVPLVLKVALGSRSHLTTFGTDYDTPDGTCIRDYVHVSDLARVHVLALQALERGSNNSCYNLGTGKGFSVKEVIQAAREVTGRSIAVVEGPRRPGDAPRLVADATKAKRELGWQARYVDLSQIIATAWHWVVKRQPEASTFAS
jgi:UDP-arabinose 4-epimerase